MSQQYLDALFTRGSHNWGVSVILVTQHLFNKELRVSRTNSHYLVLMRNPAGALQIRTIATHLFPSRTAYFMEAYRDACAKNFGYLLVDMHPERPSSIESSAFEKAQNACTGSSSSHPHTLLSLCQKSFCYSMETAYQPL
ncbi:hypothetical protein niasHT_036408 [Heterodera trifolii]|uniref:Uncharacterized protein n=1 Tax=Heterodera trifolii TaxID=157864 RepID=A0ABD2HT04_9BILA